MNFPFDVIFDIDGTLADNRHRLPLITKDMKPNWEKFLSAEQQNLDVPIIQTWTVLRGLVSQGCRLLFLTGRYERTREQTWNWLTDHSCSVRGPTAYALATSDQNSPRHLLLMRPNDNRSSSQKLKLEMLKACFSMSYSPILAFDDRKEDIKMYRSQLILSMQVAEGNF